MGVRCEGKRLGIELALRVERRKKGKVYEVARMKSREAIRNQGTILSSSMQLPLLGLRCVGYLSLLVLLLVVGEGVLRRRSDLRTVLEENEGDGSKGEGDESEEETSWRGGKVGGMKVVRSRSRFRLGEQVRRRTELVTHSLEHLGSEQRERSGELRR